VFLVNSLLKRLAKRQSEWPVPQEKWGEIPERHIQVVYVSEQSFDMLRKENLLEGSTRDGRPYLQELHCRYIVSEA
jgi:hypothetical protein